MTIDELYKDIDFLIKIEINIFNLYEEIIKLKLQNKIPSKEYLEILDLLTVCLEAEDRKYKNNEQLNDINENTVEYILNRSFSLAPKINFFDDLNEENLPETNLIAARIINKINDNIYTEKLSNYKNYDNPVLSFLAINQSIDDIDYFIGEQMIFDKINMLEDFIKNEKNENIKKELIIQKYLFNYITSNENISLMKNSDNRNILANIGYDDNLIGLRCEQAIKEILISFYEDLYHMTDEDINENEIIKADVDIACLDVLALFHLCSSTKEMDNFVNLVQQNVTTIMLQDYFTNNQSKDYAFNRLLELLKQEYEIAYKKEQQKFNIENFKIKVLN